MPSAGRPGWYSTAGSSRPRSSTGLPPWPGGLGAPRCRRRPRILPRPEWPGRSTCRAGSSGPGRRPQNFVLDVEPSAVERHQDQVVGGGGAVDLAADQFRHDYGQVRDPLGQVHPVHAGRGQAAFDPSGFISRSSDRGNFEPGTGSWPQLAVNWTASTTWKASSWNPARAGWLTCCSFVGRFSLQFVRSSTWEGLTKIGTKFASVAVGTD